MLADMGILGGDPGGEERKALAGVLAGTTPEEESEVRSLVDEWKCPNSADEARRVKVFTTESSAGGELLSKASRSFFA